MLVNLFAILLIFHPLNSISINKDMTLHLNEEDYGEVIKMGKDLIQIHYLEYKQNTKLSLEINEDETYQINIHSINCNINLDFNGEILNQINLDTYSLKMNSTNNYIIVEPIIDKADGRDKENYSQKKCPLSINSINLAQRQIKYKNQTDSIFFFQPSNLNSLNISYDIDEVSEESFIALLFQFNENSNFLIEASYKRDNDKINIISKNISNSTFLFLNSSFLFANNTDNLGGDLSVYIQSLDNKETNMRFKIIEKNMISVIEKNALNYGFLTSKTKNQYYYIEVFRGEEGEIMLHNKRLYGELYAKIINKTNFTESDLNDLSKYPNKDMDDIDSIYLKYNPHSLKLSYRYEDTLNCYDGCYILVTYEQRKSIGKFPLIGYEFTLLSRSWNFSDYIPQIIDIPFNEYLIGAFEKGSISQHYYSFTIPEEAEKIIIQIEGNYIEGYYGEGREKINTMRIVGNIRKLEIINNQNVLTLNKNDLNFKDKRVTIAIRPIDYFADIFSFYYFRIFYAKENETIFFPMDSNLGNLCLPEFDPLTNSYYCYSMLANNYNELATRFSTTSSDSNEYFKIKITKIHKNGLPSEEEKKFIFIYNDFSNDVDYYFFKFEFSNQKIKNIISSFCENIETISPQIYSSQMFYFFNFSKMYQFELKNNYTLNYKYIYGTLNVSGFMDISFLKYITFFTNRNFRGKPFAIDLGKENPNITIRMTNAELFFYFRLEYNMQNKGVEEIKSGETKSQIMTKGNFPLYYYLKITDEFYINLDINLRLNSYDDSVLKNNFDINGYLLDEDSMKRKINGEFINLPKAIKGMYSNKYKVGLIQVNQMRSKNNNDSYLLIEIMNNDQNFINSELLVELVAKENKPGFYFLPINQYIIETFDGENNTIREKNQYYMNINQIGANQVLLELSPEYNELEIQFINKTNSSEFLYTIENYFGFRQYRILKSDVNDVYFNVINPKGRNANYLIRYFYTNKSLEYNYLFNENPKKEILESNDEYVTVSLIFDDIKIIFQGGDLVINNDIYFYMSGLLFHKDENSEELLNTTNMLQEQVCLYESKTVHYYNLSDPKKFNFTYANVSRKNNYIYDLLIQANIFNEKNMFNEAFLVFTAKIDLRDIALKEEKSYLWIILGPILGAIVLAIVIFFVIKYIRLQKANVNLQEEMKSMAYSNDVQKNVIAKTKKRTKTESDYDTTFI